VHSTKAILTEKNHFVNSIFLKRTKFFPACAGGEKYLTNDVGYGVYHAANGTKGSAGHMTIAFVIAFRGY
jgi:hypothetical protein